MLVRAEKIPIIPDADNAAEEEMKRTTLIFWFILLPILLLSQEKKELLDSAVVIANKATSKTPIAYTDVDKAEIQKAAPNQSLPQILNLLPSVVATTESGIGLGASSLSIRGNDPTRTNVTINGVSLNNPESQATFWVNIPALSGVLQNIQIQRGIGTSVDGTASFGASIRMNTNYVAPSAFGRAEVAYGSFNTSTASISAGTGLLKNGLSFELSYSDNRTDGYIRNGKVNAKSLYASLGYKKGSNALKLNYIMGDQTTGITWEGISKDMLEEDRTYNPAGQYEDEAGNIQYYDNETDNYTQHFIQLFYSTQLNSNLYWVNSLNFTKGLGHYENYKEDKEFSEYGFKSPEVDGQIKEESDFIIRQKMDNEYYVASSRLQYNNKGLRLNGGLSYTFYDGDHIGEVVWSKYAPEIVNNHNWYYNEGDKQEATAFARGEYDINEFTIFADLQYRYVDLKMSGLDKDFVSLEHQDSWGFINPKAGLNYNLGNSDFYASFAMGNKEPSRSDIKEALKSKNTITAERMFDYELGYKYANNDVVLGANVYFMEYKDQLVSTGKLSDTGYEIKENVPISYRRGIELSLGWQIVKQLRLDANTTLSTNKIKDYTAWVDTYTSSSEWGYMPQTSEYYEETNLIMSPSLIGAAALNYSPIDAFEIGINGKYVGKQYYDNTSNDDRSLPAYFVMGASAAYKFCSNVKLSAYVDNVLNNKYVGNAWVYRALFAEGEDSEYVEAGLYPQAPINFMVKLSIGF